MSGDWSAGAATRLRSPRTTSDVRCASHAAPRCGADGPARSRVSDVSVTCQWCVSGVSVARAGRCQPTRRDMALLAGVTLLLLAASAQGDESEQYSGESLTLSPHHSDDANNS